MFLDLTQLDTHKHTHKYTTGRIPLNEWSQRPITCTTHNKHKRRTSKPSAGFEPVVPEIKRL